MIRVGVDKHVQVVSAGVITFSTLNSVLKFLADGSNQYNAEKIEFIVAVLETFFNEAANVNELCFFTAFTKFIWSSSYHSMWMYSHSPTRVNFNNILRHTKFDILPPMLDYEKYKSSLLPYFMR